MASPVALSVPTAKMFDVRPISKNQSMKSTQTPIAMISGLSVKALRMLRPAKASRAEPVSVMIIDHRKK